MHPRNLILMMWIFNFYLYCIFRTKQYDNMPVSILSQLQRRTVNAENEILNIYYSMQCVRFIYFIAW